MKTSMRPAIAMIELIFAIVIIAIALLSIPSMMAVAGNASKIAVIDDDVMSRLAGWTLDKSQARWDQNYSASGSPILWVNEGGLGCVEGMGFVWYRDNNRSNIPCHELNASAIAVIPNPGDGNLSRGIEQLNGGAENLTVTAAVGETYTIGASYAVSYVSSDLTSPYNSNTATATWTLGSSANMSPGVAGNPTNLKRVVTRFRNAGSNTDIVLTFFKSNIGN